MDQQNLEAKLQFTRPIRQIVSMLVVVGVTAFGVFMAAPSVLPVFLSNTYLNGFIAVVFLIGVLTCFIQVVQLMSSVRWIKEFAAAGGGETERAVPGLLLPLANLLRSRGAHMQIASTSARSILDSVATRIEEGRDLTRYIGNLLIYLGLLGTFFGLATTVPALVETIRSLSPAEGESGFEVFNRLMTGLEGQLSGMGVAFASSLLGLAGSLVVGLLEIFAGHGQNRFYRELEEWLSSITRLGYTAGDAETPGEQNLIVGILDQMAEHMETMHNMYAQSEEGRASVDEKLITLSENVSRLTAQLAANAPTDQALAQVADGQTQLIKVLREIAENESVDAESRMRLRSIDVQMLRLMEEVSAGRQETLIALRQDLGEIAAALNDKGRA
jgi:hypothetical protein